MSADNGKTSELQLAARNITELNHEKKESFFRKAAPVFTIVSALVALSTLFINTQLRKKQVTFAYLGSDSIVQINRGALNGRLTMQYGDLPIESLYKLKFSIKNTGSSAIRAEDVAEPLIIKFPNGYRLLDPAVVEQTHPDFSITVSRNSENPRYLDIGFPLLNSGDEAIVSVNALSLDAAPPVMTGRIVDVKRILNVDLSKTDLRPNQRTSAPLLWTLSVLNGLLSLFFSVLFFAACITFARGRFWDRKWKALIDNAAKEAKSKDAKSEVSKEDGYFYILTEQSRRDELTVSLGIPKRPSTMADGWKELFAMGSTFLLLGVFMGMTTYTLVIDWIS